MKVRDEQEWSLARQALQDDGETGQGFVHVLEFWVDTAEKLMEEKAETRTEYTPIQAIRDAFLHVESNLGFIEMQFFGQILLFISGMWEHGEDMVRGMTSLEKTPYMEAVRQKIYANQEAAEQAMEQTPQG